jgi:hypothetical protein
MTLPYRSKRIESLSSSCSSSLSLTSCNSSSSHWRRSFISPAAFRVKVTASTFTAFMLPWNDDDCWCCSKYAIRVVKTLVLPQVFVYFELLQGCSIRTEMWITAATVVLFPATWRNPFRVPTLRPLLGTLRCESQLQQ